MSRYRSLIDTCPDGKQAVILYYCRGVKHVILDNMNGQEQLARCFRWKHNLLACPNLAMGLVCYQANNDMPMRLLTDWLSLLPMVQLMESPQVLDNQHFLRCVFILCIWWYWGNALKCPCILIWWWKERNVTFLRQLLIWPPFSTSTFMNWIIVDRCIVVGPWPETSIVPGICDKHDIILEYVSW